MGTGDVPVHEMEVGDSHFEDYPGEDFEKVGDFTPEKTSQTPAEPILESPSEETPSSAESRRKRIKTLAGRTDLPWVRKLIAKKVPNLSILTPILSQTAFPTNPQITSSGCSRGCKEGQLYKTGPSGG